MVGTTSTIAPQPSRWVKGNAVGAGSFGVVNLAMDKSTGELFVVKSSSSASGLLSLENEADILDNLSSPYIVQCLGHESTKEANGRRKLNLFIEFMAGGSLSVLANKFGGALDESVIRSYTREILKGLPYLHDCGIVHCDLKCQNVLLSSTGSVKLTDFGCAKRLSSSELEGEEESSCSGTPLWMAPEILTNEGLQFASDIWSLGCTIIEMATGRSPWSGEITDPVALVSKIAFTEETPKIPNMFSKEGVDFLQKCLQRDPNMRWTCLELLEHPFVFNNSGRKVISKGIASSQASVLDVASCESGSESDGSESRKKEILNRLPFSTRLCGQLGRTKRKQFFQQSRDKDLKQRGCFITGKFFRCRIM